MQQFDPYSPPPPKAIPATNRELIFGLFALILGLFGANMALFGGLNLGFAMAALGSLGLSYGYLRRTGHRGNGYTNAVFILCAVIAAGFGWSDDSFVKLWMVLFLAVGVNLALCQMAGRNRFTPGSARSLNDAGDTFILGLSHMGQAGRGVADAFRSGGALTQGSGAVLAGLAIAVPALAVVIPLLISSDAAFAGLVELLPDFDLREIAATALAGVFSGFALYTRALALNAGEERQIAVRERKGLHVLTMNTALGAVCAVYVTYLFSQLAYFVGGFSGILPEGFTAAEYARRGFFEMTLLVGINLGLMTFGVSQVRRTDRVPGSTRGLCLFLGLVSEFLVAAGVAKMVLYIDRFGLTRLRVLTMVIMAFFGITAALVSLWLYRPKLQYMKYVMLIALTIGAAVMWLDVDTQVANYNVSHYLSGDLDTVDLDHLFALGPGAVPAIEKLTDCADPNISSQAVICLRTTYFGSSDDFRSINYIAEHTRNILSQWQTNTQPAAEQAQPLG